MLSDLKLLLEMSQVYESVQRKHVVREQVEEHIRRGEAVDLDIYPRGTALYSYDYIDAAITEHLVVSPWRAITYGRDAEILLREHYEGFLTTDRDKAHLCCVTATLDAEGEDTFRTDLGDSIRYHEKCLQSLNTTQAILNELTAEGKQ